MQQSIINLSKTEKKFLISLLSDGSKTDADIARDIRISKAQANRIRKKLQQESTIVDYLPIVSLEKIGVNLFIVLQLQWNHFDDEKLTTAMLKYLEKDPHTVYLATGEGSNGFTHTIMFGFSDMSEYNNYFKQFRGKYGHYIEDINTFFIPTEKIIKQDYTDLVRHKIMYEVIK